MRICLLHPTTHSHEINLHNLFNEYLLNEWIPATRYFCVEMQNIQRARLSARGRVVVEQMEWINDVEWTMMRGTRSCLSELIQSDSEVDEDGDTWMPDCEERAEEQKRLGWVWLVSEYEY